MTPKAAPRHLFTRIASRLKPFRALLLACIGIRIFDEIFNLIPAYVVQRLFDAVTNEMKTDGQDVSPATLVVMVAAGYWIFHDVFATIPLSRGVILNGRLKTSLTARLKREALERLMPLSLGYHIRTGAEREKTVINRGTDAVSQTMEYSLFQFVPQFVRTLVILTFIASYSPFIAGIEVVLMSFLALLVYERQKKMKILQRQLRDMEKDESVLEKVILDNVLTVKLYGLEEHELARTDAMTERLNGKSKELWIENVNGFAVRNFIRGSMRTIVILYGYILLGNGGLSIGAYITIYGMSSVLVDLARSLVICITSILQHEPALSDFFAMVEEELEVVEIPKPVPLADWDGSFSFDRVSFSYRERESILHDVSFGCAPGEMIAFVGQTGSGKSTLIRLLLRAFDPQQGVVYLGKTNLRDVSLHEFYSHTAIIPQDHDLFEESIFDNIRKGKLDATLDEVRAAAKKARVDDFIMSLRNPEHPEEQQYGTLVGERGKKLSGGERQRIIIARALLREAKLIILDEPTSQLDAETEAEFQASLDTLQESGATVVMIAHRLSTIRRADQVVVMRDGCVVEIGEPSELRSRDNGHFRRLLETQIASMSFSNEN